MSAQRVRVNRATPQDGALEPTKTAQNESMLPTLTRHSLGRTFTVFPQTDGTPAQNQAGQGQPTQPGAAGCDEPIGMVKITTGKFKGGKKMEDYYGGPSNGMWAHGDTAGPFVTTQWVGSNVQLIGTVSAQCKAEDFHLKQMVSVTKDRLSGQKYPGSQEGQSFQDAPVPHRQVWTDGAGLNISSADGPAADYKTNVGSSLELDRSFTTSLIGPKGTKSVDWSTSIFVKDGKIVRNTIS